jgi:predicted porin
MKKSLIALAVLAAAGTASAQSSVTLFGTVDAALQHVNNGGAASVTRLVQGSNTRSEFGLRGSEDLGGGMAASFWIAADVTVDDGTGTATSTNNQSTGTTGGGTGLVFNARSTVSLSGNWGELRLGRDYTPGFRSRSAFDPFGTRGVGTNVQQNAASVLANSQTMTRASNSIGYFLPEMGGAYGELKYWLGENPSNLVGTAAPNVGRDLSKDGRGAGIRVGYASGPFNIAAAYDKTKYNAGPSGTTFGTGASVGGFGDFMQSNIGGSWDFGMAKAMAVLERDKSGTITAKGWNLGVIVPVGAGDIKASYGRYKIDLGATDPEAKKFSLGYVHNLSKRTAIYAAYARVSNSGGGNFGVIGTSGTQNPAAANVVGVNQHSTGYELGLRHNF